MTVRRMRIVCRIPKATNTRLDYVLHISFPLQQSLHWRFSMLCYTCIACLFEHVCHILSRLDFAPKNSPPVNKMSLVSHVAIVSLLQGDCPVLYYQFVNSKNTMLRQLTGTDLLKKTGCNFSK